MLELKYVFLGLSVVFFALAVGFGIIAILDFKESSADADMETGVRLLENFSHLGAKHTLADSSEESLGEGEVGVDERGAGRNDGGNGGENDVGNRERYDGSEKTMV
jgi:hypothetical protein